MRFEKEEQILAAHLAGKGLKSSRPRDAILRVFLESDRHLTAEELLALVRRKHPAIGIATVYRTLKLLCECGLSRETRFESGTARYERLYGHDHHDHLVCLKCGRFEEAVDPDIERLQERLAKKHGFRIEKHRMEIYGACRRCRE